MKIMNRLCNIYRLMITNKELPKKRKEKREIN